MLFKNNSIAGSYVIELEPKGDDRGFFSRVFCEKEFKAHGLETHHVQMNCSMSHVEGTLRGLHFQIGASAETKLVKCLSGKLWDVVVDLRRDSPSFGKYFGVELSAENRKMLYVPKGCAHGFITLQPKTEIFYCVTANYSAENERGLRWNDPTFKIEWPVQPKLISPRDESYPNFNSAEDLRFS
jgi:dTDP-4-dehydrorhamnose 3,5-epimerase